MRLKLELDEDATKRLVQCAAAERRPVPWQAEVLLRQALGLSFPYPSQVEHANKIEAASQGAGIAEAHS